MFCVANGHSFLGVFVVAEKRRRKMVEEKRKLKIVYLKTIDPIAWTVSDKRIYAEDVPYALVPTVQRVAGIVIAEDEETISIGEHNLAEDNPKLAEWGITYPYYRYCETVLKKNILERKDFEVEA